MKIKLLILLVLGNILCTNTYSQERQYQRVLDPEEAQKMQQRAKEELAKRKTFIANKLIEDIEKNIDVRNGKIIEQKSEILEDDIVDIIFENGTKCSLYLWAVQSDISESYHVIKCDDDKWKEYRYYDTKEIIKGYIWP